jgi:hypothetical protein
LRHFFFFFFAAPLASQGGGSRFFLPSWQIVAAHLLPIFSQAAPRYFSDFLEPVLRGFLVLICFSESEVESCRNTTQQHERSVAFLQRLDCLCAYGRHRWATF